MISQDKKDRWHFSEYVTCDITTLNPKMSQKPRSMPILYFLYASLKCDIHVQKIHNRHACTLVSCCSVAAEDSGSNEKQSLASKLKKEITAANESAPK